MIEALCLYTYASQRDGCVKREFVNEISFGEGFTTKHLLSCSINVSGDLMTGCVVVKNSALMIHS